MLGRMSPQRRTALVSVVAACALIGLKLGTAISTNSLGLLSEAAHSRTDLIAATPSLVGASLAIAWRALWRLAGLAHGQVDPKGYALVVVGIVMVIDVSRAFVSYRTARRMRRPALE